MKNESYSFEDIERSIESINLADFEDGGAKAMSAEAAKASPADFLKRLCEIYKAIRPILVAVSNFPLIPPKWRRALRVFISVLDRICG